MKNRCCKNQEGALRRLPVVNNESSFTAIISIFLRQCSHFDVLVIASVCPLFVCQWTLLAYRKFISPQQWRQGIRLRPDIATPLAVVGWGAADHASPYGPSRPNVTSSIKLEVNNMLQSRHEDPATATGDLQKQFRENRSRNSRDMLADRQTDAQTDRQTDKLIAILRFPTGTE